MEWEEARKWVGGVQRFLAGEQVGVSTGIHEETTYGYGYLDVNGFWQYPVPSALVALRQRVEELERVVAGEEKWHLASRCPAEAEVRRLEGLAAAIAQDALGDNAPINRGLNSVQAVLRHFMPDGQWTEERLAERIRELEARNG